MKINRNFIKIGVLFLVVISLYAFSDIRSGQRKIENIQIEFVGDQNLYITHEMVNKLLILSYGDLTNLPKENIVLNTIEKAIEANDMVKKAQVYFTVDGGLKAKVSQRKPIGRVEGISSFYMDEDGLRMPFSKLHSARVPIITGKITENSLREAHRIITFGNADEFLRKNIIGIHITEEEKYQLRFRVDNFVVVLGSVEDLERKFANFRAFYVKASK